MGAIPRNKLEKCIKYLHQKLQSNRASDRRHATVFLLCLHGLRVGEVINLAKADLRPKLKSIFIRTLKGGANRQVPIDPITWTALLAESQRSPLRIAAAITNYKFAPLDSRNLRRVWGNWRRRFACKSFRIHDLRHTCARFIYVKSKHDPFAAKQVLGHKRIETTFGYLSAGSSAKQLREFMPTSSTGDKVKTILQTQAEVEKLKGIIDILSERLLKLEEKRQPNENTKSSGRRS